MLTQERYQSILSIIDDKNAVTVSELAQLLNTSESTIRRDLTALDEMGKLQRFLAEQLPCGKIPACLRTPFLRAKSE